MQPRADGLRARQLSPSAIARLPLLQQSTRPDGWRQWFDAQGVDAPRARSGPRYELFSMLAIAAAHGLGVALMPQMLIEPELARGELVVACNRPLRAERGYFLVTPAGADARPALTAFQNWLVAEAATGAGATAKIPPMRVAANTRIVE